MSGGAFTADDYRFMARALQLAERGLYSTRPNPRVGCVLVKNGKVVGEGWHERAGEPHAEVRALQSAGAEARGAACYVTLEPCSHHGRTPPCTQAVLGDRIAEIVVAMTDPNPLVASAGVRQLQEAGIRVRCGLLSGEAEKLNIGFCQRMRRARPWVRAKIGMSIDGRIAMASGESKWITGDAARRDVQRLRARSGAVMTGIGTVIADDPELTVRDPVLLAQIPAQPLRVVVDTHLRTPATARLLRGAGETLVVTAAPVAAGATPPRGAEVIAQTGQGERVNLSAVLSELARRDVNEVLVEAGPTLTGALLQQGLIDELICYVAPRLLGDEARPMARLPGIETLDASMKVQTTDVRQIGSDLRLTLRPLGRGEG